MTFPKQWAIILLALLLIAVGMIMVLSLSFQGMTTILGVMAIIAGVLFLIGK
jgi:uncharacterized membrane protein HdeD (DUF308 family)